ncbi:3-oxoacyl-ACP reductase [Aliidiomarina taiwanensis]|uniref:3-oxoacyl-ACP reductase n=1 Tax=Aliidiomarina taiwanensis TaxID=946228 RepID=A0A432X8R3_9GAMM|nr:SDR family NAD(P)-dependent oxidoreductase [Aliidiomarina taiwanensis]RUO43778.1 3-oxoacyl-ACP reductase [Aliidiomarina taiwanensis]
MIEINLADKHVLITGASRGIGAACAKNFAAAGATLYLNGRESEKLSALCLQLSDEYGVTCHSLPFNVSKVDEVQQGFQQLFKLTKKLDVLVNNAGILDDALIGMVTPTQVENTFATNTYSVLYCSQYAARLMQRGGSGSIINVASIIGRVGNTGQAVYGASKAAVIGITKSLAKELAPVNIRVNAVAPGFIETDMTKQLSPDKYQERLESIAMGRVGTADNVADTILFLASNLSTYVTGQTIGVDGGMLI